MKSKKSKRNRGNTLKSIEVKIVILHQDSICIYQNHFLKLNTFLLGKYLRAIPIIKDLKTFINSQQCMPNSLKNYSVQTLYFEQIS